MRKAILYFLIIFGLISCNSKIEGEGIATADREIAVDSFQELGIKCNCDVTLIPSENTKIVVESHQNLIDNLIINQKGKKLEIGESKSVNDYKLYNVNIYFTPTLNKIRLNGQTKVKISGTLKAEKLEFELEDNSSIDNAFTEIDKFEIELEDNSSAKIKGTAIKLNVDSSDNSKVNLSELQTVSVNFKASDNSELSIYPLKNMSGKALGNSSVIYKGNPVKNTIIRDKASIEKIN